MISKAVITGDIVDSKKIIEKDTLLRVFKGEF